MPKATADTHRSSRMRPHLRAPPLPAHLCALAREEEGHLGLVVHKLGVRRSLRRAGRCRRSAAARAAGNSMAAVLGRNGW